MGTLADEADVLVRSFTIAERHIFQLICTEVFRGVSGESLFKHSVQIRPSQRSIIYTELAPIPCLSEFKS